ncbi:MAG: hypothetical protein KDC43_23950 [Saprospiraceae bacterium]|nr:hypothetical protein [Saprospiraceae bacterium]MCB0626883.1 hypothetical protein [Saprospiraceae bacterium]MCB0677340.1 hypothetical protein [Saprospiraceae bacterium]MCB0681620.1 hypothetical protein [Saprospiraceae bacterium]
MKTKLLNAGLILSSLFAYLEWGQTNSMFLIQGEIEVISKLFSDPTSVLHPFTLIPLFGQVLLLVTLFQKQPSKVLSLLGLGCIAILLLLIFAIGLMVLHVKIIASTLPFLIVGYLTLRHHLKKAPL